MSDSHYFSCTSFSHFDLKRFWLRILGRFYGPCHGTGLALVVMTRRWGFFVNCLPTYLGYLHLR